MIFSPLAYPGYNWMAQAVSDLSPFASVGFTAVLGIYLFFGFGELTGGQDSEMSPQAEEAF